MKIKAYQVRQPVEIDLDDYEMRDIALEFVRKKFVLPKDAYLDRTGRIMHSVRGGHHDEEEVYIESPSPLQIEAVKFMKFLYLLTLTSGVIK